MEPPSLLALDCPSHHLKLYRLKKALTVRIRWFNSARASLDLAWAFIHISAAARCREQSVSDAVNPCRVMHSSKLLISSVQPSFLVVSFLAMLVRSGSLFGRPMGAYGPPYFALRPVSVIPLYSKRGEKRRGSRRNLGVESIALTTADRKKCIYNGH